MLYAWKLIQHSTSTILQLKKEGKKYSSLLKHPSLCFHTFLLYFLLIFMSWDCLVCMFVVSVSPTGMCTLWGQDLIFLSLLFTNVTVLWVIHTFDELVNGWMKSLGPPFPGRLTRESFPASTCMGFGFLICKMGDLPSAYGISVETCVLPPQFVKCDQPEGFLICICICISRHPPTPNSLSCWFVCATDPFLMEIIWSSWRGADPSSVSKEFACNAGDPGFIAGSGRSHGSSWVATHSSIHSCLENPMDRGAWQATVYGVARVEHDLTTKPTNRGGHWHQGNASVACVTRARTSPCALHSGGLRRGLLCHLRTEGWPRMAGGGGFHFI